MAENIQDSVLQYSAIANPCHENPQFYCKLFVNKNESIPKY